jgi:GH18 family chitinase
MKLLITLYCSRGRYLSFWPYATLLFVILSLFFANSFVYGQKSIHQEQLEYYDNFGKVPQKFYDSLNHYSPQVSVKSSDNCTLEKVVYGFWPYWGGSTYTNFHWNLISDLVYFSYEINPETGYPHSVHDWATSPAVTEAIQQNTRVSICANLFGSHSLFLQDTTAQQNFIATIIDLLKSRGGKGVCIDFEGISSTHKSGLTIFMESLANQVHSAISGSIVTIVLPAVEWSDKFDVATMQNFVDYFVIMGYDYYYSGSSQAGPVGPLYSMTSGYNYNLNKSITTWVHKGVPEDKLILGLPYYGREWSTESDEIPSNTTGSSSSRTYKYVMDNSTGNYNPVNKYWNNSSFSTYYVFKDNNWYQCFIDDGTSLGKRIDLINQRNLAGMGIWALGYDDGYPDYWNKISDKLSTCKVFPVKDSLFDSGGPEQDYYNFDDYTTSVYTNKCADKIALSFKQFNLQDGGDSLFIYAGSGTEHLIGSYSGQDSPGDLFIDGRVFTFRVKNNASVTDKGWKAVWQAYAPEVFDDFELNSGHFNQEPIYSASTVGVALSSESGQTTNASHAGQGALMVVLNDDPDDSSDWLVCLLSGSGVPENNFSLNNFGTITFEMKTGSASDNAKIQIWINVGGELKTSSWLSVINNDRWHKYSFDLSEFLQNSGECNPATSIITLNALVLSQNNSSSPWKVFFDDVGYDAGGTGTMVAQSETDLTAKISTGQQKPEVIVYPTFGTGIFDINYRTEGSYLVEVMNIAGTTVYETVSESPYCQINASTLPDGVYLLILKARGERKVFKIGIKK